MSEATTNASQQQGSNSYPQNSGYRGQAWFNTQGNLLNAIDFIARQINSGQSHASLVKVISVSGGGSSAPAMVAVQPMVDQVDGFGTRTAHGTIHNIPCFRYQAGVCAFIVDPIPGDIGLAVICDRDISQAKATGDVSAPGSARQNSWADGCYFGAFLGKEATTTVALTQDGKVTIVAPGGLFVTGDITTTGTLTNNGVNISSTHVHGGVEPGAGNTAVPH